MQKLFLCLCGNTKEKKNPNTINKSQTPRAITVPLFEQMAGQSDGKNQPDSPGGLSHRDMTSVPQQIKKQASNPPDASRNRKQKAKHSRQHSKFSQLNVSQVDGTSVNTSKRSRRRRKRRHSSNAIEAQTPYFKPLQKELSHQAIKNKPLTPRAIKNAAALDHNESKQSNRQKMSASSVMKMIIDHKVLQDEDRIFKFDHQPEQKREREIYKYSCLQCRCYFNRILQCTSCNHFICLQCAKKAVKKKLNKITNKIECPQCGKEKPHFSEFEPSPPPSQTKQPTGANKPLIQQHYWDKTPTASLTLDERTVLQLQPTRERQQVSSASKGQNEEDEASPEIKKQTSGMFEQQQKPLEKKGNSHEEKPNSQPQQVLVKMTSQSKKDNEFIQGIHHTMLKQGSIEDQINKRPLASYIDSPARRFPKKLKNGNNQLKFGQKAKRNQEGSIVGNEALNLYKPKINSRNSSTRNLKLKQQSPTFMNNYKLNGKKYQGSKRNMSRGGSMSSRGNESDPELIYRVDIGERQDSRQNVLDKEMQPQSKRTKTPKGMLSVKPGNFKTTLKFKYDASKKAEQPKEQSSPDSPANLGSNLNEGQVCYAVWDYDKIQTTNLRRSKSLNGIQQLTNAPRTFVKKQTETGDEKFRASPQTGGQKMPQAFTGDKQAQSDDSSETGQIEPMMMWDDDEKYIPKNPMNEFWDRDRPVIDLGNNCYGQSNDIIFSTEEMKTQYHQLTLLSRGEWSRKRDQEAEERNSVGNCGKLKLQRLGTDARIVYEESPAVFKEENRAQQKVYSGF